MKHDTLLEAGVGHEPCRYGRSRMIFRGPPRPLDGRHIAFVGGSATHGRLVPRPFPALLEEELGEVCVNFGQVNASVEAFLGDPLVGTACRDAVLTVVEVMGAANLSNRLYSVHPRRNDRFLRASPSLRAIYPDVDFADVCFTRHLLQHLHDAMPERFDIVREELQMAWLARMRTLLDRIGPRVLLVWTAARAPGSLSDSDDILGPEPTFVTPAMIDALRPQVLDVAMAFAGDEAVLETDAAAHQRVAAALLDPVRACLARESVRLTASR
ncbi:hypothetical protein FHG66_11555 [Rubellimicrobium rubrum]|uniref:DUF6473 domain-containing protein n=1 Tax=Rubellimicrobium rubrum TaxID=2585369 RepID=A0A5C4MXA8_9RHOB|nr:DUF6473 family protein [Rubellimicrobium rubrum]TNC49358.1 hypothetical protein FHG66_11555 [Rubellimicrobium rubrum]